jgi:hypothetical protein
MAQFAVDVTHASDVMPLAVFRDIVTHAEPLLVNVHGDEPAFTVDTDPVLWE